MAIDKAFEGVGKQPGLEVWRIEKLQVKAVPRQAYGQFYSGDSYILLKTNQVPNSNRLEWDVHFWLGKDTTQDEAGAAAIKTVELDDSLGGSPVQHREVQDHESALFLSYFKTGIQYLDGGVASGFKHVVDEIPPTRLFKVKGKKNVRVRQVPVSCNSLNQGDVFILETATTVFQWVGPNSNIMERIKAAQFAKELRDNRRKAGAVSLCIIEDDWDSNPEFFAALGGHRRIKKEDDVKDDVEHERITQRDVTFWKFTDESGRMKAIQIQEKPFLQRMLDHNDAFLLDTGSAGSGIFVWIGKGASAKERQSVMLNANRLLKEQNYPNWAPVTRVLDGGEPPAFKQLFADWRDTDDQVGLGKTFQRSRIAKSMPSIDVDDLVKAMTSRHGGSAPGIMPDDGKGKIQIFRVKDKEVLPVPEDQYGKLFGGDSYVIQYEATNASRDILVYYWLGSESNSLERGIAAKHAQYLDDKLGGRPIQVRVTQGKEPEHFLRIFNGHLVIFLSGKVESYKANEAVTRLFLVRATTSKNVRSVEVTARAASLNTNDVFVLEVTGKMFVWIGKHADDAAKAAASTTAKYINPNKQVTELHEGSETSDFWTALGGKSAYHSHKEQGGKPIYPPRLFHLSNASGYFTVEQIESFTQEDLDENDIMLLDCYDTVFIWQGSGANDEERAQAPKLVEEYVANDPSGRKATDATVVTVKQSHELPYFICQFPGWSANLWKNRNWAAVKAELNR